MPLRPRSATPGAEPFARRSALGVGDLPELHRPLGDIGAAGRDRLVSLLYADLVRLAARILRSSRRDPTLDPTALVHEAYQRLVDAGQTRWRDRAHFLATARVLMRHVVTDQARRAGALRRGGGTVRARFDDTEVTGGGSPSRGAPGLNDALAELTSLDRDLARVVELRFFQGLTVLATAELLGVSRATVLREWSAARVWLRGLLSAS